MTVHKTRIKRWIKALRSGDFLQTTGTLKKRTRAGNDRYCCLGVAMEVCGTEAHKRAALDWAKDGIVDKRSKRSDLTDNMRKHMGITFDDCGVLMNMNDAQKEPFTVIADHIEETFL